MDLFLDCSYRGTLYAFSRSGEKVTVSTEATMHPRANALPD
ncbi:hypothetical protein [Mesorhizobium sp. CA14]|nr:hypothetical protein [Mesorhizobium sp. CA14]